MLPDLGITQSQYGFAAGIFFIGYALFEIPSNLAGWDAFELKRRLGLKRINIGANGVAYTPLDMQARGLESVARISVSALNNKHDIELLIAALRELRD